MLCPVRHSPYVAAPSSFSWASLVLVLLLGEETSLTGETKSNHVIRVNVVTPCLYNVFTHAVSLTSPSHWNTYPWHLSMTKGKFENIT